MTLQFADRVQETTSTVGTAAYALGDAVTSYQPFSSACEDGDQAYYTVTDGTNWEVGLGTYSSSGDTLARTEILASSNAGAAVSWSTGSKTIFLDVPAAYFSTLTRQVSVAGTITQLVTDKTIVVMNNGSGGVNVDLLPSPGGGNITVVDGTGMAGTNNITLVANGSDDIGGESTLVIQFNRGWATLAPVSGGWVQIG